MRQIAPMKREIRRFLSTPKKWKNVFLAKMNEANGFHFFGLIVFSYLDDKFIFIIARENSFFRIWNLTLGSSDDIYIYQLVKTHWWHL